MGCGASAKRQRYGAGAEVQDEADKDSDETAEPEPLEEPLSPLTPSPRSRTPFTRREGFILDYYDYDDKFIHKGSIATVRKVSCKKGRARIRTVKQFIKSQADEKESFREEADILTSMGDSCENVIRLYDIFEDGLSFYLVYEFCAGGDLHSSILEMESFCEREAANVAMQMLQAMTFMHSKDVCHRDIRPEHVALKTNDVLHECTVKIVDFSTACFFVEGGSMTEVVSAPYYTPPQMAESEPKYTEKCDVWQMGAVLYSMLFGYPRKKKQKRAISRAESEKAEAFQGNLSRFSFSPSDWENASENAQELLHGLLEEQESVRLSAEEALGNLWVQTHAPQPQDSKISLRKMGTRNLSVEDIS